MFLDSSENEKQLKGTTVETEKTECFSETDEIDFNNHFIIPNNLLLLN